jgi:hypothetical protein
VRESPLLDDGALSAVDDGALSERGARTCSSARPRPVPLLAPRDPELELDERVLLVDGRLDADRLDPDDD